MTPIIEITAGQSRCSIAPELGGSIAGWSVLGQPMLRQTSAAEIASGKRLGLSSFPLVPWSNRIGAGRFVWGGHEVSITPNFAPEPHAIHGVGWNDIWQMEAQSANSATLTLDHKGDPRWPWAFSARQILTVKEEGLTIAMSAQNNASEAAPLGFGHHPYFDQQGASLWFNAKRVWMNDDDRLPTGSEIPSGMFDFSREGALGGRAVDHCFAGWNGKARIAWEGRPLGLLITSDLPAAVVYIPEGEDRFCFEPVPHSNNALNCTNADPPMPVVAPGGKFKAVIRFEAVAI